VNRTIVLSHVERAGVPRHSDHGKWDAGTLAEAASLYEQGHSLATIGERFGIHAKTVATRLRHGGVELRPRRGRAAHGEEPERCGHDGENFTRGQDDLTALHSSETEVVIFDPCRDGVPISDP